jgi:hypothetical protein
MSRTRIAVALTLVVGAVVTVGYGRGARPTTRYAASAQLPAAATPVGGLGAASRIEGRLVAVSERHAVLAVADPVSAGLAGHDLATGQRVWERAEAQPCWSVPALGADVLDSQPVAARVVFTWVGQEAVRAVDADTGVALGDLAVSRADEPRVDGDLLRWHSGPTLRIWEPVTGGLHVASLQPADLACPTGLIPGQPAPAGAGTVPLPVTWRGNTPWVGYLSVCAGGAEPGAAYLWWAAGPTLDPTATTPPRQPVSPQPVTPRVLRLPDAVGAGIDLVGARTRSTSAAGLSFVAPTDRRTVAVDPSGPSIVQVWDTGYAVAWLHDDAVALGWSRATVQEWAPSTRRSSVLVDGTVRLDSAAPTRTPRPVWLTDVPWSSASGGAAVLRDPRDGHIVASLALSGRIVALAPGWTGLAWQAADGPVVVVPFTAAP